MKEKFEKIFPSLIGSILLILILPFLAIPLVLCFQLIDFIYTDSGWVSYDTFTVLSSILPFEISEKYNFLYLPYIEFCCILFLFYMVLVLIICYAFFLFSTIKRFLTEKNNTYTLSAFECIFLSLLPLSMFIPTIIVAVIIIFADWHFGAIALLFLFIIDKQFSYEDIYNGIQN